MDALKKNLNYRRARPHPAPALVGWIVWPQKKAAGPRRPGGSASLALAAYAVLNLAALKQGFQRKSFLYSGNMHPRSVVLVLAILGLANYFLSKHNYRVDFTAAKLHSLSDQSVTVLKALKTDISFKGFFREGNYGRAAMENLLKIYAYHSAEDQLRVHRP